MKWILDTNVISEIATKRPNPTVLAWIARQPTEDAVISLVTMAELRLGIASAPTKRQAELLEWMDEVFTPLFGGRVLPVTVAILIDWLGLGRQLAAKRTTRDTADLLIASTARIHDLIVVTRNTRDFAGTGVLAYSPWTDETKKMDLI